MSELKQQLCAGVRVDAVPAKVRSISTQFCSSNDPATVILSFIGGDVKSLTPNEARTIADMLAAAADVAEPR